MGEVIKIILVVLLSSVKFVAGPSFAYYDQHYDFTFFETVFYCVVGGMLGVVAFSYFSVPLFEFWHWIQNKYHRLSSKKEHFIPPVADVDASIKVKYDYIDKQSRNKKIFTKRNRKIVRIWTKYGLFGIALLTPIILSIPLGTLIANSLESNRKKIVLYMFVSILFWSLTMTSLFAIYHAHTVRDLQQQIQH
jgi:hypothetical protein